MANAIAALAGGLFEIEQADDTIIVVPVVDLREMEYQGIEEGARAILGLLNRTGCKNVVLDFYKTDNFGSTALGFFVKLWYRVRRQNGRMAFCDLSGHEKEVLQITTLDQLWPICSSRSEAVAAVKE